MSQILEWLYAVVWGAPALVLILGVGLYLSFRTGFVQLRLFKKAAAGFLQKLRPGQNAAEGISPFQALCTALAATVGTGNLAGVAGAITIGGPGAIFWMWICGLLGMVIKLAEAALSVRFRVREDGEYFGGPMYMISRGMKKPWLWLGSLYSFFGVIAALGVGNATQINAVLTGINDCIISFGGTPSRQLNLLLGCGMAVLVLVLLLGGARGIGKITEMLVPFAATAYLLLGTLILVLRAGAIPAAFGAILQGAFSPNAVTGGVVGSLMVTLRVGVSRGVFTNEAGMGTAGIAHAGANVRHPMEQGLMGIMEVFLDTIVICTMTALVILCSGISVPYGRSSAGAELTMESFALVLGDWVRVFITLSLCLFAFATVLGWGLYGARCAQYLFGKKAWKTFAVLQGVTVILGALLNTGTVWLLAEIVNGLMAIPNLIALTVLSPELSRLIIDFQRKPGIAGGGTRCRYLSTQTAVSPRLCGNSTPTRWRRRSRERKYTT